MDGSEAKTSTSVIPVEAALTTTPEENYDNVVGLVESYMPTPAVAGDTRSMREKLSEALVFIDRWPRIMAQLADHDVELSTFFGIRIQLEALSPKIATKWRAYVNTAMRDVPAGTKLGVVYNWTCFTTWLKKVLDEEAAKEVTDEGTFLVKAEPGGSSIPALGQGCLACGPAASHESAVCQKVSNMTAKTYNTICLEKGWCKRCAQSLWSLVHARACAVICGICGRGHLSSRHQHAPLVPLKKRPRNRGRRRPRRRRMERSWKYDEAMFKFAVEKAVEAREAYLALVASSSYCYNSTSCRRGARRRRASKRKGHGKFDGARGRP